MAQTFVNLTQHDINEVTTGTVIQRSGKVVRITQTTRELRVHNLIPIYVSTFGKLTGLPPRKDGVVYIVSALALNEVPDDRTDVVAPGNLQRDERGQPIGCVGFRAKDV